VVDGAAGGGSWFQRRREAYWKERSVIRRGDDVDGRASVRTKTKRERERERERERGVRTCTYRAECHRSAFSPARAADCDSGTSGS